MCHGAFSRLLVLFLASVDARSLRADAGLVPQYLPAASHATARAPPRSRRPELGLFDFLQEDPAQKAAREAAKEAEFRAQQEMLQRRRDPAAMEAYMAEVEASRAAEMAKDSELKAAQQAGDLEAWQKLKDEGKVKVTDQERERAVGGMMGNDGLIAERIDEKMPFIDAGYVDESAPELELPDFGKAIKNLFGGKE